MQIRSLDNTHLPEAAGLVCARYKELRQQESLLPERYESVGEFLPKLEKLLEEAPGIAAIRSGRLVGFMTGYLLPEFLGVRAAYSPEWANAAVGEDERRTYEEMYAKMSETWIERGCFTHALTLFAKNQAGLQALQWLAFGYAGVDGIREVSNLGSSRETTDIFRAQASDYAIVAELLRGLGQHIAGAPVFWPHDMGDSQDWLNNPRNAMLLAAQDGEVVGCLGIGPANQEACTIIQDEGTASIVSAYTRESKRSKGVATALLDQALCWARESGYDRCTVDFEAMNFVARRFWLKWFRPVCFSLLRCVNEQSLAANQSLPS